MLSEPSPASRIAVFSNAFFLCHPDRSAAEIQEISGAEWRDPDGISSAMPLQGILPQIDSGYSPTLKERCFQTYAAFDLPPAQPDMLRRATQAGQTMGRTP